MIEGNELMTIQRQETAQSPRAWTAYWSIFNMVMMLVVIMVIKKIHSGGGDDDEDEKEEEKQQSRGAPPPKKKEKRRNKFFWGKSLPNVFTQWVIPTHPRVFGEIWENKR